MMKDKDINITVYQFRNEETTVIEYKDKDPISVFYDGYGEGTYPEEIIGFLNYLDYDININYINDIDEETYQKLYIDTKHPEDLV